MSHAFIRETDDEWLQDIGPSVNALVNFLTRENNGVRVYLQKTEQDAAGREMHFMSNGLRYFKDDKGTWTLSDQV